MKLEIKQIDYHRNGVGGLGFHAVLFSNEDGNFLATVFEEAGAVSVINLDRIEKHGVTFGPNSWRGDRFEPELRAAVKAYQQAEMARWEKVIKEDEAKKSDELLAALKLAWAHSDVSASPIAAEAVRAAIDKAEGRV